MGLFARLPLAMLTVGTLTLITSVTGSYALGGTAAGAVGIGSAIGALADRRGQRPVLLVASVLNALAVLALIAAAYAMPPAGAFPPAVLAAAFVSGASCPQVGPLARVRWMALTSPLTSQGSQAASTKDLDTALSYESTADELTFVLGPAWWESWPASWRRGCPWRSRPPSPSPWFLPSPSIGRTGLFPPTGLYGNAGPFPPAGTLP